MAKGNSLFLKEIYNELNAFDKRIKNDEEFYFDTDHFKTIISKNIFFGKFEMAYSALEYAKKLHPKTVVFLVQEGVILYHLNRIEEAIEALNRAALIHPKDYNIYNYRSQCYFRINEEELAKADREKAVELGFDKELILKYDKDREINTFKKRLVDTDPIVFFNEERTKHSSDYETLKKIEKIYEHSYGQKGLEVINFFRKIAEDKPSASERWMFLGLIYKDFERYTDAIEALEFSTSLDPGNAQIYHLLGHTFTIIGKREEAITNFRLSIELSKTSDEDFYPIMEGDIKHENIPFLYYWIGSSYMGLRKYKDAETAFRIYNELAPEDDGSWTSVGKALSKQKLYEESLPYFKKGLELDQEYTVYVLCFYAYAYLRNCLKMSN
jgi:tetratricopeptide (TPR) repeat protein